MEKYYVKCHIQKDNEYWDFIEWKPYEANSISEAADKAEKDANDNYAACDVLGVLSEVDYNTFHLASDAYSEGYRDGYSSGYREGHENGYEDGYDSSKAEIWD